MPTKHQRRQAVKAMILDGLSERCVQFEPSPSHGLTADEVGEVQDKLGKQLYDWACRITPEGCGEWDDQFP